MCHPIVTHRRARAATVGTAIAWALAVLPAMSEATSDCFQAVRKAGIGDCFPYMEAGQPSPRDAFASGSIPLDRIQIGSTTASHGITRLVLIRRLGDRFRVIEPKSHRDCVENARHFCRLIQKLGSMLYYYHLAELKLEDGWFEVVEWDLPRVGTLRAFLSSQSESGPLRARLYMFTPPPAVPNSVRTEKGKPNVYIRSEPRRMIWNAGASTLAIDR